MKTLGCVDYVVIALMIAISVGIGIYYRLTGGKQKTAEEYFSANRSMSAFPIGIALMVSFMSAITLLGVSAENYMYGMQFVEINISYLLGTPIVCYCFLPVFYKLQASSTYEYLEKRFGVSTRLLASIIVWLQMLLYSGVVLYAPALALEATSGLSRTTSILSTGLACAFYSSIGGIKAVLITDVFQGILMFVSLIIVITTAAYDVGGLDQIWKIATTGGRLNFNNFSTDPTVRHTWWNLTFGGFFTFLSLYGVNQIQVQRLLTVKSLKSAQRAIWLCWPVLTCLSILTCFSGLAIYSKYYNCDPSSTGAITQPDMLMPYYVMETMSSKPGLTGLFIAGIFSAGLSTISAALNSLAVVSLEDYIKPCYYKCTGKQITPSKSLILGKFLAFILGILCIALAVLAQYLGSILQMSLTIFGVVGGPLLGLFTLGMLFTSTTQRGAIIGSSISLIFLFWISFGRPRPRPSTLPVSTDGCVMEYGNPQIEISNISNTLSANITNVDQSQFFYLYRISYMWYAPLGTLGTITIGWLASNLLQYFGRDTAPNVDPDLLFPFIAERIITRSNGLKTLNSNVASQKYMFDEDQNVEAIAI